MLFYLLMLVMLAAVVRREARGRAWSVWLDCVVGSMGAASVLAVVLNPVLASAMAEPPSLGTVVAVAYPMLDLLLVAALTGLVALRGVHGGNNRTWLLIAGLLFYTAADVIYALRVTSDTYVVGTPVDAFWAIGVAFHRAVCRWRRAP